MCMNWQDVCYRLRHVGMSGGGMDSKTSPGKVSWKKEMEVWREKNSGKSYSFRCCRKGKASTTDRGSR